MTVSFDVVPPDLGAWKIVWNRLLMFADKHTNLASHQASSSLSSKYKSPGKPTQLLLISHNKTAMHTHTHFCFGIRAKAVYPQTGTPRYMISLKALP